MSLNGSKMSLNESKASTTKTSTNSCHPTGPNTAPNKNHFFCNMGLVGGIQKEKQVVLTGF
jgi:hypothetical protein